MKLFLTIVVRAFLAPNRDTGLGVFWHLVTPIFQVVLFGFVFQYLIPVRWNALEEAGIPYSIFLYTGLVCFQSFTTPIMDSANFILSHKNIIAKIRVSIASYFCAVMIGSLIPSIISVIVLNLYAIILGVWEGEFLLIIVFVSLAWFVGLCFSYLIFLISSFYRDTRNFIGLVMSGYFYFLPILYPLSSLPEFVAVFSKYLPVSAIISSAHAAIGASDYDFVSLAAALALSMFVLLGALAMITKLEGRILDAMR